VHVSRATERERDVPFERFHDRVARIAIPLEFFSVPVNVLVLLGEPLVVIDTGPRIPLARERTLAGFEQLGKRLQEVGHVIVTHHHVDHLGLLEDWVARGARAWAHQDELENCLDVPASLERRLPGYRKIARSWGFSDELLEKVCRDHLRWGNLAGKVARASVSPIPGEDTLLPLEGRRLRAIHVPGHSEGQIVIHDEEANVLFSADHILERVTPNPVVYAPTYRGRMNGLKDYLESLEKLASLPRDVLVCPGHGAPFRGLHARLDEIRRHHLERRERIRDRLTDRNQTVLDLVEQLWPGIDRPNVVLASREVFCHLDLLVERSEAVRDVEGETLFWRRGA
jgi:glyoxylase-like metal-dependent hydrolase (beta-lactamase superfamily II)